MCRRPDRSRPDEGFTLVELMVAMSLFLLVVVAVTPLTIGALKSAGSAKFNLQGKALAQERLERLRNLPFHVAQQNGQYIDLLDTYFRDSVPGSGSVSASDSCSARSYTTATATYSCTVANLGAPYTNFTQVVESQFMNDKRVVATPASTYNSQSATSDAPVTNLLSVKITTGWRQGGADRSFVVRSQIVNGLAKASSIETKINVRAVSLTTDTVTGDKLSFDAGILTADGSLTDGSTVSVSAAGARGGLSSGSSLVGATFSDSAPTSAAPVETIGSNQQLGADCSLLCFDSSNVTGDKTVDITNGLPVVSRSTNSLTAGLVNGTNGFSFSSTPLVLADPLLLLNGPMVTGGTTAGTSASAQGYVDANGVGATSVTTAAKAVVTDLRLFPTTYAPQGVLKVHLTSATLTCVAGAGTSSLSPTASWSGSIEYVRPDGTYASVALAPGSSLPPLTTVVSGSGLTLARYIASWGVFGTAGAAVVPSGDATIASGAISAVFSLITTNTRAGDDSSTINLNVGGLSCLAKDAR